jgi:TolB-like protein/AraC-like DNA-binding protein
MTNGSPADDVFIKKLQSIIQAKISESDFGVNELAREMGMSRSNLHRRVSNITGNSVVSHLSEARLKKAMELLREQTHTVSEVSWKAGFGSATYFNRCFSDYYGYPPGEAAKHGFSEHQKNAKHETENQLDPNKKKILIGGISLIALVSIILVFILVKPFSDKTETLPKTIAVLPFYNDSKDSTNLYVTNGIMDGIITRLSKISDLSPLPRSSVEFYRKNRPKSNIQIAKELDVKYIVDGSGQKTGDELKITLNLLEGATGKLLVSEQFTKSGEEILDLESEMAILIANTLKAAVTPEESEQVEQRLTDNIAAYNFFLQAQELSEMSRYNSNNILNQQAEFYMKEAIRLDSTFSEAYNALGWIISSTRTNYDSILYLANRALHFDNKNVNAHELKGTLYTWVSTPPKLKEAENEFLLALKYSNGLYGNAGLGLVYGRKSEYLNCLKYLIKSIKYIKDPNGRFIPLSLISRHCSTIGLNNEALLIAEKIKPGGDSLLFYYCMTYGAVQQGDFNKASKMFDKLYDFWDPEHRTYFNVKIMTCLWLRDYKFALKYAKEYEEKVNLQDKETIPHSLVGYVYLKNEQKEKADYHLSMALKYQLNYIEESSKNANQKDYLILVSIYLALGNKEMALKTLEKLMKIKEIDYNIFEIANLKNSPIYETIADELEFQKYISSVENRFIETQTKSKELIIKEWKVLGFD